MATKTKRKRKGSRKGNPTTHAAKSGSPKRKRKPRRAPNPSHTNPTKKRRKARKPNPSASHAKSGSRKKRRKTRKSNPATGTMKGKEPRLKPKNRRKARGMKRMSTRTVYKSRNKTGKVRHYALTKHFPNPIGNVKNVVVLGIGTLFGYEFTDMADRAVATMSPSNAPHAWYGSDAAHRIMARPNGMRMLTQVGLAALFFGGSVLSAKKYPMVAYGLAGAFIGSVVHFGHQILSQRVWPMIGATDKGNERTWGNRMYPMEQSKLMDLQDKALEVQDKAVEDAKDNVAAMPAGMQDGATKGNLPDSYLYPTAIQYARRVTAGRLAGTPELQSPPSRIREADFRTTGREPATAAALGKGYEGEPTARPRSSTLACGGCGGCGDCSPQVQMDNTRIRTGPSAPPSADRPSRQIVMVLADRSNQPCKDMSNNDSVTDASGQCIEMIRIPGGGGDSSGRGGLDLSPPPEACPPCDTAGSTATTGGNASGGAGGGAGHGGMVRLSPGVDLKPANYDMAPTAAPSLLGDGGSIESLASGGQGPHSTSSLLP